MSPEDRQQSLFTRRFPHGLNIQIINNNMVYGGNFAENAANDNDNREDVSMSSSMNFCMCSSLTLL